MSDQIWLGVDLGTQSVRVIALDGSGTVLGTAARPLSSGRDGVRHEQDPEQWWSAFSGACREALAEVDGTRIGGVAIDATSGTILLADARGAPLTAGLMYDDGRATEQTGEVNAAGERVWHQLGYQRMQTSWALPKLLWLCRHVPAAREHGTRLLHQPDLLTWRLAGRRVAGDASHALKTGYHLVDERWPMELFDDLGIPEGLLPPVVRPGTVLAGVCRDAAERTGIPAGTPIVAGMTDGCAAQLSAGALDVGSWNSVLGTTLVLKGVAEHLVHDPRGLVYCHRGPQGTWLPGGASSSGAGALRRLLPDADPHRLTEIARRRLPNAVAYPLAGEQGERFPLRAPGLEPFVLGSTTDDVDVFHAVLLGVACVERLCLDYLDLVGAPIGGAVTVTGGSAGNDYWSQLRADLLGRGVRIPERAESAIGMAVLAATSSGWSIVDAASSMVRIRDELAPATGNTAALLERYQQFVDHLNRAGHLDDEVAKHALRGQ